MACLDRGNSQPAPLDERACGGIGRYVTGLGVTSETSVSHDRQIRSRQSAIGPLTAIEVVEAPGQAALPSG